MHTRVLPACAAFASLLLPFLLHGQDGQLDPSFSGDGQVSYDMGGNDEQGVDVAVRPDGLIWVLGNSYDALADAESILLMRFHSDGTPDNAFFSDGVEEISVGTGYTFGTRLRLQADGSLLIGGYFIDDLGYTHPIIFKADANGVLVPGFGTSGLAMEAGTGNNYRITDLGVQSDGTIAYTAARTTEIVPAAGTVSSSGIFSPITPYVLCSNNNRFNALCMMADDRVLITGQHGLDSASTNFKTFILALDPDMSGDTDFSPGYICGPLNVLTEGIEYYDSGNPQVFRNDVGNDIVELPGGDLFICGASIDTADQADVYRSMLLKVHPDNSVDGSFGVNGFIKSFVGDYFRHLLVDANGKVVAVGGNFDGSLALARFYTDGTEDPGFGTLAGHTYTQIGSLSTNPGGMALQPDGRILVAATATGANGDDLVVLRYNGGEVGIPEQQAAADMHVFPDPAHGPFTVTLPTGARRVTITDATGHIVLQRATSGMARMEMQLDAPGSYLVLVDSPTGRSVRKVVVM